MGRGCPRRYLKLLSSSGRTRSRTAPVSRRFLIVVGQVRYFVARHHKHMPRASMTALVNCLLEAVVCAAYANHPGTASRTVGESMTDYCVLLSHRPFVDPVIPRTKLFYLSALSADRAVVSAVNENPQWRAIGVEPKRDN